MSSIAKLIHASRAATSSSSRNTKLKKNIFSSKNGITTATPPGYIHPAPSQVTLGLVKAFCVATPGVLLGSTLAKNGAAWLEDNEIFIPDDDDD